MTERYRIRFEPLAQKALEEAVIYIREQSGDDRAAGWLRSLLASVDRLETLPGAFGVWTTRRGRPVHSKLASPYRIFFVIDDGTTTVHVIDVVHTARESRLAEYRDQPD